MLQHSSNDATSFVVDILTGTSSGTSLEGGIWDNWKYQRQIINDWLRSINWNELKGFNCCQKTWEDEPYGREKDFYGNGNENRNIMTTEGTGRLFEEIMKGRNYEVSARNYKFDKIFSRYSDIINFKTPPNERNDEGKALVIFNSNNLLQIYIQSENVNKLESFFPSALTVAISALCGSSLDPASLFHFFSFLHTRKTRFR